MKSLVSLPNNFKTKGLIVFTLGLIGMLVTSQNGLINVYRLLMPDQTNPDGSYPYPSNFFEYNYLLGICSVFLSIVGLLCFFFSREKDEFLHSIKLQSIQFAVAVQICMSMIIGVYYMISPYQSVVNALSGLVIFVLISFWPVYIARYYYLVNIKSNINSAT